MAMQILKSETARNARIDEFVPPSPTSAYQCRIADCDEDVRFAQKLRYNVFNMELGEGLEASLQSGAGCGSIR